MVTSFFGHRPEMPRGHRTLGNGSNIWGRGRRCEESHEFGT